MTDRFADYLTKALGTLVLGILTFSVSSTSSDADGVVTIHPTECGLRVESVDPNDPKDTIVKLMQDLEVSDAPDTCITVVADNVVIRLNEYSIIGLGGDIDETPSPGGINIVGASNVIIEGPGTITNFARGIAVIGSKNISIDGVELLDNSRGIHIGRLFTGLASADVTISNVKIDKSRNRDTSTRGGQGIGVFALNNPQNSNEFTENIHIVDVEIENSEHEGIEFGRSSASIGPAGRGFLVENCVIKDGGVGISIAAGADFTVRDCAISGHAGEAIVVGLTVPDFPISGVKIRDSVFTDNDYGVRLLPYNIQDDVKLRSTCFENNPAGHIENDSDLNIIELNNELDPPGGC